MKKKNATIIKKMGVAGTPQQSKPITALPLGECHSKPGVGLTKISCHSQPGDYITLITVSIYNTSE